MKTYEELEREAYINGYMRLAEAYSKAIELDDTLVNQEDNYDRIRDLEYDIDRLYTQIDELEADVEFYRQKAVRAEGKLEEIAAKIEK